MSSNKKNTDITIIAREGFLSEKKLVLFNGRIQTLSENNELDEIIFKKTELVLNNFDTRTTKSPKVQEMSTNYLIECERENSNLVSNDKFCPKDNLRIETISKRLGIPLYTPIVALISSLLLRSRNKNKNNFFTRYFVFLISFIILLLAEVMVRFAGFSMLNTLVYFFIPTILLPILYFYLKFKLSLQEN